MTKQLDHALIIHVWHLDTLEELSRYVAHFTPNADQFVTYSDSFSPETRQALAERFPEASCIPVKNIGQDVGALFQLMDQVDLSQYEFICKVHTKKGPMMPDEWRRALLSGVLGSPEQVAHIVKTFREDSDVQLAGTRQLFLHGGMNLGPNASQIGKIFGGLINDFNIHQQDWGFIAGTCFWIRTAALLRLRACPVTFEVADGYISDSTPAQVTERMFGMCAALCGGKVLLQDLRFPDRMPDVEKSWPDNLAKVDGRLAEMLTSLVGGTYGKFGWPIELQSNLLESAPSDRNRVAVFASYSSDGFLPPQVLPYLVGLKSVTKAIVVVCDNDLAPGEQEKLASLVDHVITGRHEEYDFGSYKRGVACAQQNGLLDEADDLILCNDSCYGPVGTFAPMFAKMEARALDFWGATDSHEFTYHLQSYWVVLSRKVFSSDTFRNFLHSVSKQDNVQQVILNYELGLTKSLIGAGFTAGAMVENNLKGVHLKDPSYNNMTVFPIYTLNQGMPLVKVKALSKFHTNADGQNRLLAWLHENAPTVYENVSSDINIRRFEDADDESFSVIMPTRNRAWCISQAITSLMAQTHQNFELIIIDDGSTDGTEDLVKKTFDKEISDERIKYIHIPNNVGVCTARNIGLAYAQNSWVAYLDSDNILRPYYLTMMANAIVANRDCDVLYGRFIPINSGDVTGRSFDRKNLLNHNFIDLGVFVHRKSLIFQFGNFDTNLKRLVDWDMIIRFTKHKEPAFIPRVVLNYNDDNHIERITVKEPVIGAYTAIHTKNSSKMTISTAIISYNHQEFLVEAIESAIAQRGDFIHDIMISDDGSTDGSARIIDHYVTKYPHVIRNISRGGNFGISENYKYCFRQAAGEFIAILEGDDYWIDEEKNLKQAKFLSTHAEAAMVFSRVELYDMATAKHRLLKRQDGLASLLTGADFAQNEHLNLIANFSSTMFRSNTMRNMPSSVYLPRLNEISLSFYMDRIGKIGFMDSAMGVYRQNSASVWSGANKASQLQQAIEMREMAMKIAHQVHRPKIKKRLEEKKVQFNSLKLEGNKRQVA